LAAAHEHIRTHTHIRHKKKRERQKETPTPPLTGEVGISLTYSDPRKEREKLERDRERREKASQERLVHTRPSVALCSTGAISSVSVEETVAMHAILRRRAATFRVLIHVKRGTRFCVG